MGPVVAPAGTTAVAPAAVAFVGTTRLEVLKRTPVGAVVNVPLIVTVEPTMPLEGENVGTPGQVAAALVVNVNAGRVPAAVGHYRRFAAVSSPTLPGIVASSWVSESMTSPVPAVPPNSTTVAVLRWAGSSFR